MSSETIFLQPGMSIVIDGVEMTVEEIKEHVIDSVMYRKHLEELMAKESAK